MKRRLSSNDEDDYDYAGRSKKQKTTRTSTGYIAEEGNVGSQHLDRQEQHLV
jgi:hypothetical protein